MLAKLIKGLPFFPRYDVFVGSRSPIPHSTLVQGCGVGVGARVRVARSRGNEPRV